jgi:transcriptional regulator with XRE-family HTH domain
MEKSVFNQDYTLFLSLLRRVRKAAGLTQKQVAENLKQTQSFVSKCERGERRIDTIELLAYCKAIGIPAEDFVRQLQQILRQGKIE